MGTTILSAGAAHIVARTEPKIRASTDVTPGALA
jgi:hypothetical protein